MSIASDSKKKKSIVGWSKLAKKALLGNAPESSRGSIDNVGSNAAAEMIIASLKSDKHCHQGIGRTLLSMPLEQIEAELIQIWVEKALPRWADKYTRKESLLKSLVLIGVPQVIRAEYWKMAISNPLKLSPEYFRIILVKLSAIRESLLLISNRYQAGIASAYSVAVSNESHAFNTGPLRAATITTDTPSQIESHAPLTRRKTYDHGAEAPSRDLLASSELSDIVAHRAYTHHNLSDLVAPARYEVELIRKSFEGIAVDLHRTIPRHEDASRNEALVDSLRSILEAFCLYRADIGYVQGMACLAANLLFVMDEYSAFVCFSNLVMSDTILSFYRFDLTLIRSYCKVFDYLLKKICPSFWNKLAASSFRSDVFLIEWWFTLFTRCLPRDVLWFVWDFFLLDGDLVLFQTSLALVKARLPRLVEVPIESAMLTLTSHTTDISISKFVSVVKSLKLTEKTLHKAFANVKLKQPNSLLPNETENEDDEDDIESEYNDTRQST